MNDEQLDADIQKFYPISYRLYEAITEASNREIENILNASLPGFPMMQVLLGHLIALSFLKKTMPPHMPKELQDMFEKVDVLERILFNLLRDPAFLNRHSRVQ